MKNEVLDIYVLLVNLFLLCWFVFGSTLGGGGGGGVHGNNIEKQQNTTTTGPSNFTHSVQAVLSLGDPCLLDKLRTSEQK